MPGSMTSSTTTSGSRRAAASTACRPSPTVSTCQPSAESRRATAVAMAGSSSTTSTVVDAAPGVPAGLPAAAPGRDANVIDPA